ncbi:hypothetical protein [Lysobacter fragariae]
MLLVSLFGVAGVTLASPQLARAPVSVRQVYVDGGWSQLTCDTDEKCELSASDFHDGAVFGVDVGRFGYRAYVERYRYFSTNAVGQVVLSVEVRCSDKDLSAFPKSAAVFCNLDYVATENGIEGSAVAIYALIDGRTEMIEREVTENAPQSKEPGAIKPTP